MKNKLSPRDQKAISALSDGQLKPKEQLRIEERLSNDVGLREAFTDLERTRQVLRTLPKLKAPRSFVLSPDSDIVLGLSKSEFFPSFRLVSAFATILFIIVVIGDFYNFSYLKFSPRNEQLASQSVKEGETGFAPQMEAAEAPAVESLEVASDEIELEKSIVEIPTLTIPVEEFDVAGAPKSFEGENTQEVIAEAPLAEPEEMEIGRNTTPLEEGEALEFSPIKIPESEEIEEEIQPTLLQENYVDEDNTTPGWDVDDSLSDKPDVADTAEKLPFVPESQSDVPSMRVGSKILLIRFVEILLGLVALATGIIALLNRRRG